MLVPKWHLAVQIGVLAVLKSSTYRCYDCDFNFVAALIWTTSYLSWTNMVYFDYKPD
jgi:hypothetical protein